MASPSWPAASTPPRFWLTTDLRQLTLELMDETIAIANACGHRLPTARRTRSDEANKSDGRLQDLRPCSIMRRAGRWRLRRSGASRSGARRLRGRCAAPRNALSFAQVAGSRNVGNESIDVAEIAVHNRQRAIAVDRAALATICGPCLASAARRKRGPGLTSSERSQCRAGFRSQDQRAASPFHADRRADRRDHFPARRDIHQRRDRAAVRRERTGLRWSMSCAFTLFTGFSICTDSMTARRWPAPDAARPGEDRRGLRRRLASRLNRFKSSA